MATIAEYTAATEALERGELTFAPAVWAQIDDYGELSHENRIAYEASTIRREIGRALWQPWARTEANALAMRLAALVDAYETSTR